MKKVYTLLSALVIGGTSFAQAIDNPGMETWRSGTSGTETVYAPTQWYGMDSAVIDLGASFALSMHPQLFQSTTVKNSGTSSAMLISVDQDMVGILPAMLSNAQPTIDVAALTGGADPMDAVTFSGGTATTLRITSVSAYVNYTAGKDTAGVPGNDTANLVVQSISVNHGIESVVGTGTVQIPPTSGSAFVQVTANVVYTDTIHMVSIVRFIFASGGNATLDSSTLYVDDVSMVGVAQVPIGVAMQHANTDLVKVYPNPTSGIINLSGTQNAAYTYELSSINGQVVATKTFKGQDVVNVASLPSGLYFYSIVDAAGNKVQSGKITLNH